MKKQKIIYITLFLTSIITFIIPVIDLFSRGGIWSSGAGFFQVILFDYCLLFCGGAGIYNYYQKINFGSKSKPTTFYDLARNYETEEQTLKKDLKKALENQDYKKAAKLRDKIENLKQKK